MMFLYNSTIPVTTTPILHSPPYLYHACLCKGDSGYGYGNGGNGSSGDAGRVVRGGGGSAGAGLGFGGGGMGMGMGMGNTNPYGSNGNGNSYGKDSDVLNGSNKFNSTGGSLDAAQLQQVHKHAS